MNQARAFCIEYGLAMRIGAGGFHADIRRPLANPEHDLTQNMRALLNDLLDDLATIEGRVKALSARIEAIAKEGETIRRLLTSPGIGALGAPALVAAAGDGRQFREARDMAAWLGLAPAAQSTEARPHRNKAVVALANKLTRPQPLSRTDGVRGVDLGDPDTTRHRLPALQWGGCVS